MKELIDLSGTKLGAEEKNAVTIFCKELQKNLNENIQSITLYGSAVREDYRMERSDINLLVVLKRIDIAILKSILDPVAQGRRFGIAPFVITEVNLRTSTDVFPVKFLAMQESYRVLFGRDILGKLEIKREHLRLRCEQEVKNLLLRMRRYFLMRGGKGLTAMMSQTIVGFLETLRAILSLTGEEIPSRDDVVNIAAKKFGFEVEILRNVIALRDLDTPLPKEEAEQLYDKFMAIVDKVAQITDQMD